jgi:hypothetical protein
MTMHPALDDLDRCKIALQYLAELQSVGLTALLELLLERMDEAIEQVDVQLHQCTCQGAAHPRVPAGPAPRGVLTVFPGARQPSPSWAPRDAEEQDAAAERRGPDA